jgi:hypothetical protein
MNKSAPRYIFCNLVFIGKSAEFNLHHLVKGKKHSVTGLFTGFRLTRALIGELCNYKQKRSPSDFRVRVQLFYLQTIKFFIQDWMRNCIEVPITEFYLDSGIKKCQA